MVTSTTSILFYHRRQVAWPSRVPGYCYHSYTEIKYVFFTCSAQSTVEPYRLRLQPYRM